MTLRHFRIFAMVAETNSFTKAAQKLYITQSAVSHAIRELEEECGTLLFDRLSKRIQLNQSGVLFLEEIRPILAAVDALQTHMPSLSFYAPIHIVTSITIATFLLPPLLAKFKEIYPSTSVYVEVVSAANALEILHMGKADLALVEGTHPVGPYHTHVFASYALKIVCSPSYPINKTTLSIEDFVNEKLLLREKGSAIRDTLDSALYLGGYTVYPLWTSVNSLSLIAATKAGLGITVLPDDLIQYDLVNQELIELTINDYSLKNDCILVTHQDKFINQSLQVLLSLIKSIE